MLDTQYVEWYNININLFLEVFMTKGNVKALIYDLLSLIDNAKSESCEEIEQRLNNGKLVSYLLDTYNMPCFSKVNTREVSDLLKEKAGCNETNYGNCCYK